MQCFKDIEFDNLTKSVFPFNLGDFLKIRDRSIGQ